MPAEKPYYSWSVVDVKTGAQKALGNFLATPDESTAYRYFDQLAVSHTIWSPDSSSFIYAGVHLDWIAGQGARICARAVGVDRANRRQRAARNRKRSAGVLLSSEVGVVSRL